MAVRKKRKEGGQKGNQNARKHGFYAKVLNAAGKKDLKVASDVDGIDDEIALMRVKIKNVLEKDPENVKLIMEAITTLAGLLKTRFNITKEQQNSIRASLGKLIREVALPLGISVASTAIGKKV
jgi:hypothetical protein